MRLLIVADDVSGAADCAAGCAASGLRTVVLLDGGADASGYDVVAVDADSRHLPPERAGEIHVALLRRLAGARSSLLYKKIDSTLRGPIAAELAATRGISGTPILAPAFPAMGRTVVDGQVLIHGIPLQDTEVWKNEGRAGPSTLPAMLRQVDFDPVVIGLEQIRGDLDSLRAAFAAHATEPNRAIVCDAETEDDLARIAVASAALAGRCQWVGSGGLVRHFAAAHRLRGAGAARREDAALGPVLTVVGSVSSASRRQCEHLAQARGVPTRKIEPDLLRRGTDDAQWTAAQWSLRDLLLAGEDVVVTIGGETRDLREGRMLAASLARLLGPAWAVAGALMLTGGDTARAMLSANGVRALEIVGEVEAGVPLSVTVSSRRVPVVTKAGAFGADDCLTRAWRLLKSADRMPPRKDVP